MKWGTARVANEKWLRRWERQKGILTRQGTSEWPNSQMQSVSTVASAICHFNFSSFVIKILRFLHSSTLSKEHTWEPWLDLEGRREGHLSRPHGCKPFWSQGWTIDQSPPWIKLSQRGWVAWSPYSWNTLYHSTDIVRDLHATLKRHVSLTLSIASLYPILIMYINNNIVFLNVQKWTCSTFFCLFCLFLGMGPTSKKAKEKEERPERKREQTVSYPEWCVHFTPSHRWWINDNRIMDSTTGH